VRTRRQWWESDGAELGYPGSIWYTRMESCTLSSSLDDLTIGTLHMLPVRPMKSPELIDTVVRVYELIPHSEPIDLGGSSNLNLLFPGPDGGHVVRIYRAWVTPRRLEGIQSVRATLRAAGLPFTQTRLSVDGRTFIHFADWLVEVEPFVDGQDMTTWAELKDGTRMLGTIHTVLSGIAAPPGAKRAPAANHIDVADASQTTRRACAAIRAFAQSSDEERIASLSEELANALLCAGDGRSLEDFWDNNVKFRDGSLVAVLDLDFMEEGTRIDDLALVLYYANSGSTLADLRSPLERMQALRELVDAYDSSLERHLAQEERAALPLVLARTPLKYARHLLLRASAADQRAVAMAEAPELLWALSIAKLPGPWQAAFC
jgi:Ser/Thr protein kinase RdoA (MazF antagonist)